jgi:tetratricopeptide (TPR) repeat protein/transglutaminase-like putative cysteine protease
LVSSVLRGEVSREPPLLFASELKPLLTPVTQVLKADAGLDTSGQSGATLVSESIRTVDAEGRQSIAVQVAYRTLTEAGVSANAEDVFSYRRSAEKFYLVTAETIQPDGTVLPVKSDAILLQTPQRESDDALYNDKEEVRVIYPDVKPGSVTHAIWVIEATGVRMPGEFSRIYSWDTGWPAGLIRDVIELPSSMEKRLRIFNIGNQVPEPSRETLAGDRVRLSWSRARVVQRVDEVARAPTGQVGPASHVTTIPSWDVIGNWYWHLIQGTDQLNPVLSVKINEWTKSAKNSDEVVRVLLERVANDVRYVGLELGEADYRPHDCNEVWENQYGDCKDKANLLVAFLKNKGVPAWVALVNTEHLGIVDKRAPDFREFNHAIVAISSGSGGYLFCDPTIMYARPGLLSPDDADRDVLVVKEKGSEWVRTPVVNAGSTSYRFDLKLNSAGELSGWLTLTSDGYYGLLQRQEFNGLDPDASRKTMIRILQGFFPDANLIDFANSTSNPSDEAHVVKAFFISPVQKDESSGKQTLTFVRSPSVLVDMGSTADRETSFFLYRDRIRVTCSIDLPINLVPGPVPIPYDAETPIGVAHARWLFGKTSCQTELDLEVLQSAIPPKEFGRYFNLTKSLRTWMEGQVVLSPNGASPPQIAQTAEMDLPLMPSGDGQLELVDNRYPENGDRKLRRAALERTLQYFPKDRAIAFRAGVRIAAIDWNDDKNQQALDRLQSLIASYKADVSAEIFAWAEIYEGLALRDLKREKEAVAIFVRLAGNSDLTPDRRSTAAVDVSDILRTNDPARALALLKGAAGTKSSMGADIYPRMARLMLDQNDPIGIRKVLEELARSEPADFDDILTAIAKNQAKWTEPGDDERQRDILAIVTELAPKPTEGLKNAIADGNFHVTCAAIRKHLIELLTQKPLSDWYSPLQDDSLKTADDYSQAITKSDDPDRCLQLGVRSLAAFPVDNEFPKQLWTAAGYGDWKERRAGKPINEPIYELLLDLCDQLPKDNKYYYEGRILRAKHLERVGNPRGAQAIYDAMLLDPGLIPTFFVPVTVYLGASLETTGDYPKSLETYRRLEPYAGKSEKAANGLLRAVFINLSLNDQTDALRVIGVLESTTDATLKETLGEAQIREFISLEHSGEAKKFWDSSKGWWQDWKALSKTLGAPAEGVSVDVPVIPDLQELGKKMGEAIRDGNRVIYLADLNQIASSARWLPSMAAELAGLSSRSETMFPDKGAEFRRAYIAILDVPMAPTMPGWRNRQVYLAANYIDENRYDDSLKVVKEFNSVPHPDDALCSSMHRLWAIAAVSTRKEIQESATALEADLKNADFNDRRAASVGSLADLYRALGRVDDLESLLKRELNNSSIIADSEGNATLRQQYQQLNGSRMLVAGVKSWIRDFPLDWYDFAEPFSLDDRRLRDLDAVLKEPETIFSPAERIKLELLVAQDATRGVSVQATTCKDAILRLYFTMSRYDEEDRLADTVIRNPGIDDESRFVLLATVLDDYAELGRKDSYARWRHDPLVEKLPPRLHAELELFDLQMATDRKSSKSVKDLTAALSANEINLLGLNILQDSLNDFLRLGDINAAKELLDQARSWKLSTAIGKTNDMIVLAFSRDIRAAEATAPIHEALGKRALEYFPDVPSEMPSVYDNLRLSGTLQNTSDELTLKACLWQIKNRQFDRTGLGFWTTFLSAAQARDDSGPFILDIVRIALGAARDDEQRAEVIQFIMGSVDMDNSGLVQPIRKMLETYRHPVEAPLTYAQIRILEITLALRTAAAVNLDTAFDGLRSRNVSTLALRARMVSYLQSGNTLSLRHLVDSTDSSVLLDLDLLEETIPAFDLLGMKAEAETVRGIGRRNLKVFMINSWVSLNESAIHYALRLAEILGDPENLPAAWVRSVSSRTWNPVLKHEVLMEDAWLHKDWAKVGEHSAELIKLRPTYYHYYWYRGMALHQLGKDKDSVGPLSVYVRIANNEMDHPAAVALLQKIGLKDSALNSTGTK